MNTGTNLNRAIMITLCEPSYDPELYKQALKRVHRLEQREKISVYVLFSDTTLRNMSSFKVDAFKTVDAT
jgi:SNF2 family DNA or RNA helicase